MCELDPRVRVCVSLLSVLAVFHRFSLFELQWFSLRDGSLMNPANSRGYTHTQSLHDVCERNLINCEY